MALVHFLTNSIVMESYAMRNLCLIFLFGISFATSLHANDNFPEYDEALVIERLNSIEDPLIEPRFNSVVRGYIKSYLYWSRRKAELVTGRSVLFFPIIENQLKQRNLPEKLKYLPVVESALNPHAQSPVGAVGLWQFMPATALDHDLLINKMVDERKDPHKSTRAALDYLSREYEKYGSWALALAAYNGGSGRVSRAIKRGRSKNFWKIRRYLPRETRNYVPAYIAATYLMEYYKEHEVVPDFPNLELQITSSIRVYQTISFHRIAQITGLSLDIIEQLNPAYKRGIIPANDEGNYIILPNRVMQAFRDYLDTHRPDHLTAKYFDNTPVVAKKDEQQLTDHYRKATYIVQDDETLAVVATRLNCSEHQLIAWNKLAGDSVQSGLKLVYYHPKELIRFNPMEKMELPKSLNDIPLSVLQVYSDEQEGEERLSDYFIYIATCGEKLSALARRLPGVSLPMLMDINTLPSNYKVRKGDQLLIPKP
jgi:membrane-bound lytic murein transglycosylase D